MNRTQEKSKDPEVQAKFLAHKEAVDRYHGRAYGFENYDAAKKNAEASGIDPRKVIGAKIGFGKNSIDFKKGHHRGANLGTSNPNHLRRAGNRKQRRTGSKRGS